ncbi:MAG: SCP2 sterol-binding domain-containing protein [Thermoplasmata archaeon]
MVAFPSQEWIETFREKINANDAYASAAKDWEGDFLFVVEPEGDLNEPATFYVDLWHGKCREARILEPGEEVKAAFTYAGPYRNWVRLIEGQIDPIRGLLTGKFHLKGSMMKVMRYTKAAKILVQTASEVPTEFPGT